MVDTHEHVRQRGHYIIDATTCVIWLESHVTPVIPVATPCKTVFQRLRCSCGVTTNHWYGTVEGGVVKRYMSVIESCMHHFLPFLTGLVKIIEGAFCIDGEFDIWY